MQKYWVDLFHAGRKLGTAFFLTRRFVLTANHCLRGVPDGEVELVVDSLEGRLYQGKVYERLKDSDLALIRVLDKPGIEPLQADRCRANDMWRVPSRPEPSDPRLQGEVVDPGVSYKCEGGGVLEALQLRTNVVLGDYSGYSGGPVERQTGDGNKLAGVLLEQYPDRRDPEKVSNTLFAATIAEVMARFDCFDLGNLLGLAFGTPAEAPGDARKAVDDATVLLEGCADWEARGLMSAVEVSAMRLRVARSVVDQTIARRTR